MAVMRSWVAPNEEALGSTITTYIAQGFMVANRTATKVTMVKRKQFSILMVVIGFFLCLLPLLVYLLYYAMQTDQVIELTVAPPVQAGVLSPDGYYWWTGTEWAPVAHQPHAPAEAIGAYGAEDPGGSALLLEETDDSRDNTD